MSHAAAAHAPGRHAHHFDSVEQQRESATLGMWLFLLTEIMFFGGLFMAYLLYRFFHEEAFAAGSHHLDIKLGGFNTAVLIGSSLTMALAVRSAQLGRSRQIVGFIVLTMILGAVFLGVKAVEYSEKFEHHLVPGPGFRWEEPGGPQVQLFFFLYFCMTGLHAAHMVIGMFVLAAIAVMASRGAYSPDYYNPVEGIGLYWHFVDVVWIFLFPLLYLIGRHA